MSDKKSVAGRTCAVMVTYHPDSNWPKRLRFVHSQLPDVIVIDNSTRAASQAFVQETCTALGVGLLTNTYNRGIAGALNQAAIWAIEHGFQTMVTFDQDSEVTLDVATALFDVCAQVDLHDVAIIGSNARNRTSGYFSAGATSDVPGAHIECDVVLFSGAMIFLDVWQSLGGFREALFMDSVDLEYCWRAARHGKRVFQALKPTMVHSAGQPEQHRIFGKTFHTINHNPKRYYYMMRNTIALRREYPEHISLSKLSEWLLRVLLFESCRWEKAKYILRGIKDGLSGTFSNPVT